MTPFRYPSILPLIRHSITAFPRFLTASPIIRVYTRLFVRSIRSIANTTTALSPSVQLLSHVLPHLRLFLPPLPPWILTVTSPSGLQLKPKACLAMATRHCTTSSSFLSIVSVSRPRCSKTRLLFVHTFSVFHLSCLSGLSCLYLEPLNPKFPPSLCRTCI